MSATPEPTRPAALAKVRERVQKIAAAYEKALIQLTALDDLHIDVDGDTDVSVIGLGRDLEDDLESLYILTTFLVTRVRDTRRDIKAHVKQRARARATAFAQAKPAIDTLDVYDAEEEEDDLSHSPDLMATD